LASFGSLNSPFREFTGDTYLPRSSGRRPEAAEIAEIYTVATPNYRAVMECYQNAKRVGSSDKHAT
jgi:hypothetical protein